MTWDPSRIVPWKRLIREWVLYVVVMVVVLTVFLRDSVTLGSFIGLFASLPMYLGFGWFLAKMGYQRKTLKDLKAAKPLRPQPESRTPTSRVRPASTSRTSTGPSQYRPQEKRKKH